MGLLDLRRGLVPAAAQQLARNAWMASANPPSSWYLAPPENGAPDLSGPVSLPDGLEPSFDDIHAQLLAGMNSRIGPEHLALNPDNWAPTTFGSASSSPPARGSDASPYLSYPDPLQPLSALARHMKKNTASHGRLIQRRVATWTLRTRRHERMVVQTMSGIMNLCLTASMSSATEMPKIFLVGPSCVGDANEDRS